MHAQEIKQSVLSISLFVCLFGDIKITRSGYLGGIVGCEYHYSVGSVGKLTFFSLLGGLKRATSIINPVFLSDPFNLTQLCHVLSQPCMLKLSVGKGRQIHKLM